MGVTATVFEQEAATTELALTAVYRHASGQRCSRACDRTPRCPHLAWAWRWITGEMG